MQKIYVAGPMTGLPAFNKPAFNELADELTSQGHAVLNPASLPNGLEQHEYMDICFGMVRACDKVIFLKDWQKSEGAMAEFAYAKKIGKELVFADGSPDEVELFAIGAVNGTRN